MNIHGSTVAINTYAVSLGSVAVGYLSGNVLITSLFLFLNVIILLWTIALLTRFFINFSKNNSQMYCNKHKLIK